jgi:hypothetical protein
MTTVTGAPSASPYPKDLNENPLMSAVAAGVMEMVGPLTNVKTLIDVIEQHACELQDAPARWSIEAIKSRAKTIAKLSVVLMDELSRADAVHDRLSEMVEADNA